MRRAAKIDANQTDIVEALRAIGCTVQSLAAVGHGCPDILVGYRGQNLVFEVKVGKAKLRSKQELWRKFWRGQVDTIRSFEDAKIILDKK